MTLNAGPPLLARRPEQQEMSAAMLNALGAAMVTRLLTLNALFTLPSAWYAQPYPRYSDLRLTLIPSGIDAATRGSPEPSGVPGETGYPQPWVLCHGSGRPAATRWACRAAPPPTWAR